ncbi:hypothetical protein JJV70_15625 [Streptomyces sp. JJ66]|nr:hypothetical protein [Streptomyces sp. JJ66]
MRERHKDVQAAEAVAGGDSQPGGATTLVLGIVDVELQLGRTESGGGTNGGYPPSLRCWGRARATAWACSRSGRPCLSEVAAT